MNANHTCTPVYAIVPAAGLGRRMGMPKQTLPFRGGTVLGSVVQTLLDARLDRIVVVTRSALIKKLRLPIDPRLDVAINDDEASQMMDSLRIGVATLLGPPQPAVGDRPRQDLEGLVAAGILILPGDMPCVTTDTCRRCIRVFQHDTSRIVTASYAGKRGHPVIVPASLRARMDRHDGGLDSLLRSFSELETLVETADAATLKDMDTWDQYDALR